MTDAHIIDPHPPPLAYVSLRNPLGEAAHSLRYSFPFAVVQLPGQRDLPLLVVLFQTVGNQRLPVLDIFLRLEDILALCSSMKFPSHGMVELYIPRRLRTPSKVEPKNLPLFVNGAGMVDVRVREPLNLKRVGSAFHRGIFGTFKASHFGYEVANESLESPQSDAENVSTRRR